MPIQRSAFLLPQAQTAQTVCINNAITNITYAIGDGATGAELQDYQQGLPALTVQGCSPSGYTNRIRYI